MFIEDVADDKVCGFSGGRELGKCHKMYYLYYYGDDDGVTLGRGKTSDEVQGDMRP